MEEVILRILNRGKIHEITAKELTTLFSRFWSWTLLHCEIVEIMNVKSWKYIDDNGGVILCAESDSLFVYYMNKIYKK